MIIRNKFESIFYSNKYSFTKSQNNKTLVLIEELSLFIKYYYLIKLNI